MHHWKSTVNHLKGLLPERYDRILLARVGLATNGGQSSKRSQLAQIKEVLHEFLLYRQWSLPIEKDCDRWRRSFPLKEVNLKTLESKLTC